MVRIINEELAYDHDDLYKALLDKLYNVLSRDAKDTTKLYKMNRSIELNYARGRIHSVASMFFDLTDHHMLGKDMSTVRLLFTPNSDRNKSYKILKAFHKPIQDITEDDIREALNDAVQSSQLSKAIFN